MVPDDYEDDVEEVEFEEPVEIVPTITSINAAGELRIEFNPPEASIPQGWEELMDPELFADDGKAVNMTDA